MGEANRGAEGRRRGGGGGGGGGIYNLLECPSGMKGNDEPTHIYNGLDFSFWFFGVWVFFSLKRHSFSSFISFQAPSHQILCHWHLQTVGYFEDFWYYCANWIVSWLIGGLVTSHASSSSFFFFFPVDWLVGLLSSPFFFFFLVLFTFLPLLTSLLTQLLFFSP